MIPISVEYPYMLFTRKAIGNAPNSWDELTEKQFVGISRVILGAPVDYKFLSLLTGIRRTILKRLSSFQLLQLSKLIDFIGTAGSSHYCFIISELIYHSRVFIAPKPKLEGLTFSQFIFLDSFYNDFARLKSESYLNKFVATLYLPYNEQFNNETIESRIQTISQIPLDHRNAIALNYSLIIFWLQKAYPLIFPQTYDQDEKPEAPQPSNNSAWLKIFESLVGEDLINRDRYAQLPLHTVLKHMTKKYKENARQ